MNWMVWRQHCKQFIYTGACIVIFVAIVGAMGVQTAHAYHASLHEREPFFILSMSMRILPLVSIIIPLLFGMFWGAPLIAKEYETGTNKLVWTQSTTRRQWLSAKLAWTIGIAGLYGAVLSLVIGWSLRTENAIMFDRFEWVHFDVQGLMPIVYSMFAVALGAMIGAWTRRVVLAIGLTIAIFVTLQCAIGLFVRRDYMPAYATTTTALNQYPKNGGENTILNSHTTGPEQPAGQTDLWSIGWKYADQPESCPAGGTICTTLGTSTVIWQPANRYWPFQFIEAGIYIVLTASVVGGAYWFVLKRNIS